MSLDEVKPCVQHGLYLLKDGGDPIAALVSSTEMGGEPAVRIEAVAPRPEAATRFFAEIRDGMRRLNVYRGKAMSLGNKHDPSGHGAPGVGT